MSRARRPRALRARLIGLVMVTTLVALLVALGSIIAYDLRAYRAAWVADAATQAELLGQTSAPALAFDDAKVAQETLDLLRLRPRVHAAALYTARGAPFATYRRQGDTSPVPALPGAEGAQVEGASLVLNRRIVRNDEILGTVHLRLEYDLAQRLRDYALISLAVIAIGLGVAYLMSTWLQRRVTDPLLAVAAIATEVVAQEDYSRRAPPGGDDEVGALVRAFNAMLAEIERRAALVQESKAALENEIAERTRAEQQVTRLNIELERRVQERTAELELSNQELESFSYSVSHDLRAPLRAIDGFSQALIEDFPEDVSAESRRYLTRIRAGTSRMSQLIEDLLNLSRLSRGQLVRQPVDVSALARQVVEDLRQGEPERRVDVSVWDGLEASADRELLRAALDNLIGNAWKFTGKRSDARIEVGALRDGERRVFFVRDNGAGFDMKFADKLFSPFQRLHGPQDFGGTGIGLATVQRIVQRHGGQIWADGQPGQGAAFYFTLAPAGSPAQPAHTAAGTDISTGA